MSGGIIVCSQGCCPGCQDCFGMSIGCHQSPCRCTEPCTCRYADEDDDPRWRAGCVRHDDTDDGRRMAENEPDDSPEDYGLCATCGEGGPCSYDDEGRPLFHSGVPR